MAGYITSLWRGPDRSAFLPGATTHGHYQIELSCQACHTPWNGVKENACYDCHSNETVWSWTAYLAPGSWLVVRDVHKARDEFNLSEWGRIGASDRARLDDYQEYGSACPL